MNTKNIIDCERSQFEKFQGYFLLPNYFKTIGLVFVLLGFILKVVTKYLDQSIAFLSFFREHILENIILLSMLLIALAREKIEDEMIEKIRGQAFKAAFIWGVLYAIFQPYITYFVSLSLKPNDTQFERLDDFIIVWFMLVVYLGFFHLLKKTS